MMVRAVVATRAAGAIRGGEAVESSTSGGWRMLVPVQWNSSVMASFLPPSLARCCCGSTEDCELPEICCFSLSRCCLCVLAEGGRGWGAVCLEVPGDDTRDSGDMQAVKQSSMPW